MENNEIEFLSIGSCCGLNYNLPQPGIISNSHTKARCTHCYLIKHKAVEQIIDFFEDIICPIDWQISLAIDKFNIISGWSFPYILQNQTEKSLLRWNMHPSRKIIDIIVKCARRGPFHSPSNAPLMKKLGFQTKVQKTKPKNTKTTVWILLDWFASLGRPSLYIGVKRDQLEKILTLDFLPTPENWEQICKDHAERSLKRSKGMGSPPVIKKNKPWKNQQEKVEEP